MESLVVAKEPMEQLEFMTLNGMGEIKGIHQWSINGIQRNPIRSGKKQYDSIEFHNGWKESIIFNGI